MQDSKKGFLPFRHGISLSKDQCLRTHDEIEAMRAVPYASAVGSLMGAMLYTRHDICFVVGIVNRFQSNPREDHWTAVKHILKYLKRTRGHVRIYLADSLIPYGYIDSDFISNKDARQFTSVYMWFRIFLLDPGMVPSAELSITLYCDNSSAVEIFEETMGS
ncbi:hypothetical protein Dimus_039757 [Dionaea muscipula]